jgi:hypothetical protein
VVGLVGGGLWFGGGWEVARNLAVSGWWC